MKSKKTSQKSTKLIFQFIPSLVAQLKAREDKKGSPLTEDEVIEIRDSAICMAVTPETFLITEKARGYKDIDPENCWKEWSKISTQL